MIRVWVLILLFWMVIPVHSQNDHAVETAGKVPRPLQYQRLYPDMEKADVVKLLGSPDDVSGGTHIWSLKNSGDHLLCMVEYLDGRVSMSAFAWRPGVITVDELVLVRKKMKAIPISTDDGRAVFVTQAEGSEKKIYTIIEPPEDPQTMGPMVILMTEERFNQEEHPSHDPQ